MVYKIVVIGGSGYVGGRLVGRLLRDGHWVRCLARDPRKLSGRDWPDLEIFKGNILDRESMARAMDGCDVVYYLVHSMSTDLEQSEENNRRGANIAAEVAAECGVKRIVCLESLGNLPVVLSPYLRSHREVGEILASGTVPVTEFRAAMIIGSGSASFDMMYALVNRHPIMVVPRWADHLFQPISMRDTVRYLTKCLDIPESVGKVIEIGGPDILSYKEMLLRLAKQLKLNRRIIVVPLRTPRLSSFWINLVTPIPAPLARRLTEGLQFEMVTRNDLALNLFSLRLMGFDEMISRALLRVREMQVETTWSNASFTPDTEQHGEKNHSGVLKDVRKLEIKAAPDCVFKVFASIGGQTGWYFGNILWRIRGFIDKMFGGVGGRRGRRHPEVLLPGDALDFWRVETVEVGRRVVLRAEMRTPGRAWLEFRADPIADLSTLFTQTASFYPRGLLGLAYWYALAPVHVVLFTRMAREIARRAEQKALLQDT